MDRDEALKLLRGGARGIVEWYRRRDAGEDIPDLREVDLSGADLSGADLRRANLHHANLHQANLRRAQLAAAQLREADLREADLRQAKLIWADLRRADLRRAQLAGATCIGTILADLDLSEVKGLDSVEHLGPSHISLDTLFRSRGKIPETFLRGCGLPDALIDYLPALIGAMNPIHYFTCFISYSTADEEFASRLHDDVQAVGIRCWKWNHDSRTGKSLWDEIDQAIRQYDKLVLVASESSLKSPAVNREVERAIRQEDERTVLKRQGKYEGNIDVLFPVPLDDYIVRGWEHERKADVIKKVIADAKGWDTDAKVYAEVRDRLLLDLKAEDLPEK